MTEPAPKTWRERLNLGRKFQPVDGWEHWPNGRRKRGTWRSKFARRIERRRAMKQGSRVEKSIAKARATIHEAQSLATNSHEAKRYIEALRKEAR